MATLFDVDGENLDPGYKNLSRAEFAQDRELFHIYFARYPQLLVRPVALISQNDDLADMILNDVCNALRVG